MQNFYLIRWLKENSGLDPDIIDSLKFELDNRIYFYGKQFAFPFERSGTRHALDTLKYWTKDKIFSPVKKMTSATPSGTLKISSNAYFQFNKLISQNGFSVCPVPWQCSGQCKVERQLLARVNKVLRFGNFKDLLSAWFASDILSLKAYFRAYFKRENIQALVVPFDMPFFERLAIKVFKELNRPSMIALHGLPGRYNSIDDNRADYLLVWGDRIKEYHVRGGIGPDKILVTGHPEYSPAAPQALTVPGKLRFSLGNILVLSKAMNGAQYSVEEVLTDRGNLILYLYSIRKILQKNGVKRVTLRLHPSESVDWYRSFLPGGFFQFDNSPLHNSIARASLVIGPASTVFIESLIAGVNYLVYEPMLNGRDLLNLPVVPPFDGSEPGIPVANSEEDFQRLLSEGGAINPSVIPCYIKPSLDLSFIRTVIAKGLGTIA